MNYLFESDRLLFREFNTLDAQDFYRLNENPEVLKYTGDAPFVSVKETEMFLESYSAYNDFGYGRWAVISKESGAFLGWSGLKFNEEKCVDLGFRFFEEHWNKGYATEAAKACLQFGFGPLELDRIVGRTDVENKASVRVLEKIGMTFWKEDSFEGVAKAYYYRVDKETFLNTSIDETQA